MITRHQNKVGVVGVVFDLETNEVLSGFGDKKRKRCTLTDWLMIFHKGMELMAKDRELGLEAWRVFAYAISQIDYDNKLLLTQSEIGRELKMRQQAVNRAFKLLVSKGIFIEGEKQGTSKIYYLGTVIGSKGRAVAFHKKLEREEKAQKNKSPQHEHKAPEEAGMTFVANYHKQEPGKPDWQLEKLTSGTR
jgi:DNA-binding MarR family transcriptional regulator